MGAFMVGWQWGNFFIIVTEKWAEKRLKELADEAFAQANLRRAEAQELLDEVQRVSAEMIRTQEDNDEILVQAERQLSKLAEMKAGAEQTLAMASNVHNRAEALIKHLEQEKGATEQRLENAEQEASDSKTEQLQQRIAYLEGQIDILKSLRED